MIFIEYKNKINIQLDNNKSITIRNNQSILLFLLLLNKFKKKNNLYKIVLDATPGYDFWEKNKKKEHIYNT